MTARTMVLVIAAAIAVLALAHARAHFRRPTADVEILQASVSGVTGEMLAERRPIVILDRIAGDPVESLARTVFRWQHASRSRAEPCRLDAFERARARFTLVYYESPPPSEAEPAVVIRPDGVSGGDGVAVLLAVGRVLVLPPGWSFLPLAAGARRARLDDVFTAIVSRFGA